MLPPDRTATDGRPDRCGHVGVQQRGDRGRAGRLDDELGPLEQEEQGPGDAAPRSTVTTSSTSAWTTANGTSPGQPTAMPSAIVAIGSSGTGWPGDSDGG